MALPGAASVVATDDLPLGELTASFCYRELNSPTVGLADAFASAAGGSAGVVLAPVTAIRISSKYLRQPFLKPGQALGRFV